MTDHLFPSNHCIATGPSVFHALPGETIDAMCRRLNVELCEVCAEQGTLLCQLPDEHVQLHCAGQVRWAILASE